MRKIRSAPAAARTLPRHWRSAVVGLALLATMLFAFAGPAAFIERTLEVANAALRRHPASGSLQIVEMDAHSVSTIERYPWPRRNYAAVVDQLQRAGAASIVFDVDFSSRSNPLDDAALGQAIARSRSAIVLPTFGQAAGGGRGGWTDSLPLPELRDKASLASVSVEPDADGLVRRIPVGTITDGMPRPSLSAAIGGLPQGVADRDFAIDFAIDPATIPRHSFVDIRDGKFDPQAFAGKDVIIGATAIEMGDRYAVPGYGVIPGVVIQALAAETLMKGMPGEGGWAVPLGLALAIGAAILHLRSGRALASAAVVAPLALFFASVATKAYLNWSFEIVPGLVCLAVISAGAYLARSWQASQARRARDPVTGLPNRLGLYANPASASYPGILTARFAEYDKMVAALGVGAVADLVRRVEERIALVVEGSTIYRVDDRALAWAGLDEASSLDRIATLRALMLPPVEVAGRRIDVSLNFGFAMRRAEESTDHLLDRALLAADQAQTRGLGWQAQDDLADERLERELSLLGELDDAIVAGDIDVHYQPKLALKTGRIVSVEALVRWHHRTRGRLSPDEFIPLAERNGRIAGLTLHVLDQAMAAAATWQAAGKDITVAVNISAKLIDAPDFCRAVRERIASSDLPANRLIFEVTESAAMTDVDSAAAALEALRELGIAISIDDYGTGQSTLSYLRQLPLDELKLDRKFVQHAHSNRDDAILVQSTVSLAHELGLKVVAEGVEEEGCLAFLRSIGCDMAQGYLISRPVPAAAIAALDGVRIADAA